MSKENVTEDSLKEQADMSSSKPVKPKAKKKIKSSKILIFNEEN